MISDESIMPGGLEWARSQLAEAGCELAPEIAEALEFSASAHAGQKRAVRRGARAIPYFVHPVRVAKQCFELYREAGVTEPSAGVLVCSALLHDVLEDCAVSAAELEERFGGDVTRLVLLVTKPRIRRGESASARMMRFAEQIGSGGLPSVFLKCCDLIDNVAEPETDPPEIFERAVVKARDYYLPLLGRVQLGHEFQKRVELAISLAEHALAKRAVVASDETIQTRLHNVLLEAKAPKIEAHDLVHLLHRALGSGEIAVALFPRHVVAAVVAGSIGIALDNGRLQNLRELARERGGFTKVRRKYFRTSSSDQREDVTYLACVDQGFDGGDTLVIAALPKDWKADLPGGMPPEVVIRLILGTVLRNSGELHRDLAEEALELGLELDLAAAIEVGVQRGQLGQLVRWQQQCELACNIIESELRVFFHSERPNGRLWHRVRLEHRVKSCASILRKFATNKICRWPEFATVEDVAGVRVVCPSAFHVEKIMNFISESADVRPLAGAIRRYDREPTRVGYRGVHAVRLVMLSGGNTIVPCEIQLRTALQDAWANLSHTVAYKKDHDDDEHQVAALRELGTRLSECEKDITKLLRGANV